MGKSIHRLLMVSAAVGLVATLAACGGSEESTDTDGDADTSTLTAPVSLQNCDRTITFDTVPERVVSLWQAPTEMMLALGLGDKLVAVAGDYAAYPEGLADEAAGLNQIGTAMGWPSKEVLLSQDPDLVIGQSLEGFAFDTSAGYASVERIEDTGANVYGANLCSSVDALNMTVDTTAQTLSDLGRIFDVSERADAIIAQLNKEKRAVVDAVADEDKVDVAYFNGGEGPIRVLAGGIYDSAITLAGGTNVFPAATVHVSKEEFAASDPDVILVGTYEGQDFDTLRDYLETDFPEMGAVQAGRIEEVPDRDTDASVGVMRGLTEIANALHPGLDIPVPTR